MTTTNLPSTGFDLDAVSRAEARAVEARETPWGLERRRAAAGVMKTLSFPSRTDELWRRTDFRTLEAALPELDPFASGARARNIDDLPARVIEALAGASAYALVVSATPNGGARLHPTSSAGAWWCARWPRIPDTSPSCASTGALLTTTRTGTRPLAPRCAPEGIRYVPAGSRAVRCACSVADGPRRARRGGGGGAGGNQQCQEQLSETGRIAAQWRYRGVRRQDAKLVYGTSGLGS